MNTGADSVRGADVGKGEREGFRRPRRRGCPFCNDGAVVIDYKDPAMLRYFISDRGKIAPRRVSGVCAKHQRELTLAIKRARVIALLPFTTNY
jgi:small subunit ribosomal protein S18